MSQMPRWARKQMYEQKLADTINNPYTDQAVAAAARKAIEEKLDDDDRKFRLSQEKLTRQFKDEL